MTFDQLKKLRIKKQRPALPVILSSVELNVQNEVIILNRKTMQEDFRPLIGLYVIIAHIGRDIDRLLTLVDRVKTAGARYIHLTNLRTGQRMLAVWEYETKIRDYTALAPLDDLNLGGYL